MPLALQLQRTLRLLEVGLSWPPETFVMLKLRHLARRGVEVRVGSFPSAMTSAPEPPGIKVQTLPALRGGRGFARFYIQLLRTRCDVLHFEWLTVASRCLPLMRIWDGPVVVSYRGSELSVGEPVSTRVQPLSVHGVFARADAIHVVSEATRDEALAYGLDPSKASLIRAGVDAQLFCPPAARPSDGTRFSVVSVGWLRWLKGYEYTLLAISELAREGVPVTLDILGADPPADMGEPGQQQRILHTAHDLDLDGHVRLHGNVSPTEVCAHLQRADVLLHASVTEGLPNVVVEAMACGLPVVATDVGGTREAIRDGVDGFLIAPRDPETAAARLRTLWHDPELRATMGCAGRARVKAEFTIERQTEEWLKLYQRVTSEH